MQDQHPIPRQITTFEFKLIGFLTLKQFIYLIVFIPSGFILYKLFPIPYLNILVALLVAGVGFAFAFLPVNDRPLDVWIQNLIRRLTSPTQYRYHKKNAPVYFLDSLYFIEDPHRVMAHVESREKLAAYLAKTRSTTSSVDSKSTPVVLPVSAPKEPPQVTTSSQQVKKTPPTQPLINQTLVKKPFLNGVVKNHKLIPLPGILIYIKDQKGQVMRLLKSNPHGVFATFNPLSKGSYQFEFKDPKSSYFFDTMNINIEETNNKPYEFFSKELL